MRRKAEIGTREQQTGRRSSRKESAPERVENAAQAMRDTSAHGTFRGYIPPQPTARSIPYADPRQQTTGSHYRTENGRGYYQPAPETPPRKSGGKKGVWKAVAVVAAVAVIAGAIIAGVRTSQNIAEKRRISDKISPYNQLYCPGVYVDGIHLGGMTPDQAMNSVQSQINQRHDAWKVQLVYQGNVVADINTDTLNMAVDQNQLIELMNEAWTHGHSGTAEERYAEMERLEKEPYMVYTAKPSGNTGEIDRLLTNIKAKIDRPVKDASLKEFNPDLPYPFVFNAEETGLSLEIEPVIQQLYQMVSTMQSGTVELIPEEIAPQVTQRELEKNYALRSSATTPIDKHSTDNRNNNIRRAFQPINGYILKPGKTFSFNDVVGERTLSNGFYTAIEYAYDEHVEGVGGGVCQASTTVYQAAVRAGLQILRRRPHSDSVSYTEYGKDATVYWYKGGKKIDLSFKNTTEQNIYITAQVLADPSNKKRLICKVNMYGQDLGNVKYELTSEIIETIPPVLMEPVYVSDKESAAKARDGYVVKSYRITYTDGVVTEKKELFQDEYKPKAERIYDPSRAKE